MKKLMTIAAVAAMTVVANAAPVFKPTICENCGGGTKDGDCDTVVFKVTGSGKAVTDKGSYKTVASLKIKKGALALLGTVCAYQDTERCCYDEGYFFATVKVGKKVFEVGAPVAVKVWSVFGKNLAKSRNFGTQIKKGKSVCLESALFVYAEETGVFDGVFDEDATFAFWASAFGKVDCKVSKASSSKGYCEEGKECEAIFTPKKYAGWFVGWYPCVGPEDCFRCDCEDTDIFGGTWKASYQKKLTSVSGAQGLAGTSFEFE